MDQAAEMIIPIKVRITNYKSIADSGWLWLSSDITVLAGKNESGKTAVLEAIRDFSTDVTEISAEAIPLMKQDAEPEIEIVFKVPDDVVTAVCKATGQNISKAAWEHIRAHGIAITRNYTDGHMLEATLWEIIEAGVDPVQLVDRIVLYDSMERACKFVDGGYNDELGESWRELHTEELLAEAKLISDSLRLAINKIADQAKKQSATAAYKAIEAAMKLPDVSHVPSGFFEELLGHVPQIIFFSDFENLLPFEIKLSDAKNNPAVCDFAVVAGLDLAKLEGMESRQALRNELETHSASISVYFRDYYEQNNVELKAEPDGELLRIGVKQEGDTLLYRTEQRSRGMQWFLSFFLRLNASEGRGQVILIDEPGLYLHAKAQEDILRLLEDLTRMEKCCRVIFSTHSPYLIDPDRLDRVRLVARSDGKGTIVENKLHRTADTDTLTPLVTAMGIDLARSAAVIQDKNVVVEGISDYYYLKAFSVLLNRKENYAIVPCVGATKVPQVVSLLLGWGLQFVALLDNDKAGDKVVKELFKLDVNDADIIRVPEHHGAIEDIFDADEYYEHVLENDKAVVMASTATEIIKKNKLDKVMVARLFLDRVSTTNDIELDEKLLDRISKLLDNVGASLKG